jgi:hypothetical protein
MTHSNKLVAGACLLLLACQRTREPPVAHQTVAEEIPAAERAPVVGREAPTRTTDARVTWVDPPGWARSGASNSMRVASYRVPRATGDSDDGELAVFRFGAQQGGSIEANVERWTRQFADTKPEDIKEADRTANGLDQHTVEIRSGTFASGMPGGPTEAKPRYGLLGAIVTTPDGNYFFKLTGPEKTVQAARGQFYQLLDSVKAGV